METERGYPTMGAIESASVDPFALAVETTGQIPASGLQPFVLGQLAQV